MTYELRIAPKAAKQLAALPASVRARLVELVDHLRDWLSSNRLRGPAPTAVAPATDPAACG
jgi:mRNA-degrading endonuclease RelE of RelBE toxin-antitoxin system